MTSYHVTTNECIDSILREGLIPSIGPRSSSLGESESQIYFFDSKESVENALMNWFGDEFEEEDDIFILEVNLSGLDTKHEDGQFEIICKQAVPAERILNVFDESFKLVDMTSLHKSIRMQPK